MTGRTGQLSPSGVVSQLPNCLHSGVRIPSGDTSFAKRQGLLLVKNRGSQVCGGAFTGGPGRWVRVNGGRKGEVIPRQFPDKNTA